MLIRILGYRIKIQTWRRKEPDSLGLLSLCEDGKHVVFLDFDIPHGKQGKVNKSMIETIAYLQKKYSLGDFDIFETAGGYHAICYSKVTYGEYMDIMQNTKELDPGFKKQAVTRPEQATTIRFYSLNPKKYSKYVMTIRKESSREESTAHKQAFNHLKGLPVTKAKEGLITVEYFHNKTKHGLKRGVKNE